MFPKFCEDSRDNVAYLTEPSGVLKVLKVFEGCCFAKFPGRLAC